MKRKLDELRIEFERGQQQMSLLEQRRAEVRDTLLRISGAIQVLEDLLQAGSSPNGENRAAGSDPRSVSGKSTERISI
jgi:prefoldin subunit 5